MIGFVTYSNAQLPPELIERYHVEVVALTVTVDGEDHLENVDLDADAFYAAFESGTPQISTSQPSPGRIGLAYQALADRGADEILSVHGGSAVSGTVNAARLAAQGSPVPGRIVDTGTASCGIALALWAAADAVAAGASVEEAATVAEGVAGTTGNVFVVRLLDVARAGGRLASGVTAQAIPVLSMIDGVMQKVGEAADHEAAVTAMADYVRRAGTGLRVGVGVADTASEPLSAALEARLRDAPEVDELLRYRIGPSVGAHTGPGTASAMWCPRAPR